MPDIELLTGLDRALIDRGIIAGAYAGEYYEVHATMKRFRAGTGVYFSTKNLAGGESYLRKWLARLGAQGAPRKKLTSFLRCGLAHLCHDFIEFTFECIPPEEIVEKALASFMSRNYHRATMPPAKKKPAAPRTTSARSVRKNKTSRAKTKHGS
jgi:hypothetical protein